MPISHVSVYGGRLPVYIDMPVTVGYGDIRVAGGCRQKPPIHLSSLDIAESVERSRVRIGAQRSVRLRSPEEPVDIMSGTECSGFA